MEGNSGVEVQWQLLPTGRAVSLCLKASLETRQTGDVLAGKDRRLRELFKTDRAGNAEPVGGRAPDRFSAGGGVNIQII